MKAIVEVRPEDDTTIDRAVVRCVRCRWFEQDKDTAGEDGLCRRCLPTVNATPPWPVVLAWDFCGRFEELLVAGTKREVDVPDGATMLDLFFKRLPDAQLVGQNAEAIAGEGGE